MAAMTVSGNRIHQAINSLLRLQSQGVFGLARQERRRFMLHPIGMPGTPERRQEMSALAAWHVDDSFRLAAG